MIIENFFNKLTTRYSQYLIIVTLIMTGNVHASTDQENETLAQLLAEIRLLETLVKAAQLSSTTNDRQQFDYEALRKDITMVTQGINDHLTMTRRDPQVLPPLQGAYRQ